jgi:hypothetical protein
VATLPPKPPPLAKLAPAPPPKDKERADDAEEEDEDDPTATKSEANKYSTYQLNQAELKPQRAAPPPKQPFIESLFTFPFRLASLKPLVYLAIWGTIFGFQCALIRMILDAGGMMAVVAIGAVGFGMIWVVVIGGSYASCLFFSILQETAAGNDEVSYGDFDWRSSFFQFIRLAWVLLLSVVLPGFALSLCLGWWPALIIGPATFAICLLCSLAADSWFKLIDPGMMGRFAKKPAAVAIVYVYSVAVALACAGIWWAATMYLALLAPVMGLVWAAGWLFYARLLGRAGYVLTYEKRKRKRKKKQDPLPVSAGIAPEQASEII